MSEAPTIGDWTQYGWISDGASSFPARVRLRDAAWMVYYKPDIAATLGSARRKTHVTEFCDNCDGAVLPNWKKCPWCGVSLEVDG